MDESEARDLLLKEVIGYRSCSYEQLTKLVGTNHVSEVRGPSGVDYTIEVDVFWDSPGSPGKIRVMGAIDDGHLPGAFSPLCEDFILCPDGTFLGDR
jgi:hypothetical protein